MLAKRKIRIPKAPGYELDSIYDTQSVLQNDSEVNFFPNQADRNVQNANYVSNALPGDTARLVYGLSVEILSEFIEEDAGNSIDPVAIVNALKFGGILITADQDNKEFLRAPIEEYLNFAGTDLVIASAGDDNGALLSQANAVLKSSPDYILQEPFYIAPNQVFDVKLTFNDASVFPQAADWTAAGQNELKLRVRLNVVIIPASGWKKIEAGGLSLVE